MPQKISRRGFVSGTLAVGGGLTGAAGLGTGSLWTPERTWGDAKSPNETLNIACIGVGGRGAANVSGVAACKQNIVALCDIDDKRAAKVYDTYPKAERFADFRQLLEKVRGLDAVVISTPDHTHAVAAVMAMRMGLHVYCEKPLTHSVHEARLMRQLASEKKLATQMGNQGTANNGLREAVEVVRSGAIGPVREVHCWTNRPIWPQGKPRGAATTPPPHLHWDLFLGPAPEKPYAEGIHPFGWRGYWDYGTGALGDMACHTANMAFMATRLGYPTSVEAVSAPLNPDTFPAWSTVSYQFPARDELPPLKWVWYDGKRDGKANLPPAEITDRLPLSKSKDGKGQLAGSGSVLIGDKGLLYSESDYGGSYKLLPHDDFAGYKPPAASLPRSPGHYQEWVNAIKGGAPAVSNFDYAAFLTEVVVLGNVALRLGQRIEWDGPAMTATNCPAAAALVSPEYRKGWTL